MRVLRWLALVLSFLLFLPSVSCQLSVAPGTKMVYEVAFYVFHPRGFPLANASVTVFDEDTGRSYTAYTDSSGRAIFAVLPVSMYRTTVFSSLTGSIQTSHVIAYNQFVFTPTMGLMSTVTASSSVMRIVTGIPYASVSVTNTQTGGSVASTAFSDGSVYFLNLPRGEYYVSVGGVGASRVSFSLYSQEYEAGPAGVQPRRSWFFIIILVAGVGASLAGMLLPWILGRPLADCFDVDWGEVNWIRRARDFSFWRRFSSFDVFFWYFVLIVALIFYLWVMVNTVYLKMGVSYALLLVVALVGVASGESEMGLIGFGRIERYVRYMFAGILLICVNLLVNQFSMGIVLPGQSILSVFNLFSMNAIHLIVFGPLIEEACFQMFLFPVFAQRIGMVPSTLLVAFLFGFFHWQTYGGIISILFVAAFFRVMACILTTAYMSVVPAYLGHVANNAISFMQMFR